MSGLFVSFAQEISTNIIFCSAIIYANIFIGYYKADLEEVNNTISRGHERWMRQGGNKPELLGPGIK